MVILVTGGAGFIGSHIVEYFQGKAEIRVLDNLRTGKISNLQGLDCTFIKGSITDRDLVRKAMKDVDYVFHMAALVSVVESMRRIKECVDINVQGTINVLEEAERAIVKKVVFASSAAVYGDNPSSPKTEDMCPEPLSPYAITKLDGEQYLDLFHKTGRVPTTSIRFFNVFGPRQDPNGSYAAAVPIFMKNALEGKDITIYGDGQQTRDFIYVKDIVGALVHAAMNPMHGAYNAGYNEKTIVLDLAKNIIGMAGGESSIKHADERSGEIKHSLASSEKLQKTGWKPNFTLQQALTETFKSVNGLAWE